MWLGLSRVRIRQCHSSTRVPQQNTNPSHISLKRQGSTAQGSQHRCDATEGPNVQPSRYRPSLLLTLTVCPHESRTDGRGRTDCRSPTRPHPYAMPRSAPTRRDRAFPALYIQSSKGTPVAERLFSFAVGAARAGLEPAVRTGITRGLHLDYMGVCSRITRGSARARSRRARPRAARRWK